MQKLKAQSSRPMEFLGIVGDVKFYDNKVLLFNSLECDVGFFMNNIGKYSYIENNRCYTNMRALLNAGIPYEEIPYNTPDELQHFRAIKAKMPMFVFNHFVTHTALSKETLSDRVTLQSGEYWLPSDFRNRLYTQLVDTNNLPLPSIKAFNSLLNLSSKQELSAHLVANYSQRDVQQLFKSLNYKPEIYQRAMLEFRYKTTVATGWYNDPRVWKHFLVEREAYPALHKSWVQPETKQLALSIKQLFGV